MNRPVLAVTPVYENLGFLLRVILVILAVIFLGVVLLVAFIFFDVISYLDVILALIRCNILCAHNGNSYSVGIGLGSVSMAHRCNYLLAA